LFIKINNLRVCACIIWDFDGVIKDSVVVKSDAFIQLFLQFGDEVAKKVRKHHEENGGMSRYDKLPIYLDWAGEEPTVHLVEEYAEKFTRIVKQQVVDSPWVEGVLEYLQKYYQYKKFFLVTATPQLEIEDILSQLKIAKYFKQVVGSPTYKIEAVKVLLNRYNINPRHAVVIGDSNSDYEAAKANHITFILRKTVLNRQLQEQLNCQVIENFYNE
jgi:phosphoglycolate phosphatase-like HAD superfamily hydrolase